MVAPVDRGVYFTEQVPAFNLQLCLENLPGPLQTTLPVGVGEPETVTVQVMDSPTTGEEPQTIEMGGDEEVGGGGDEEVFKTPMTMGVPLNSATGM